MRYKNINYQLREYIREEERVKKSFDSKRDIVYVVAIILLVLSFYLILKTLENGIPWLWIITLIISFCLIVICRFFSNVLNKQFEKLCQAKKENIDKEKEKKELVKLHSAREEAYKKTVESKQPFNIVSDMYSDWKSFVFQDAENYLRDKQRPAVKAAETISELKKKTRVAVKEYKEMRYKYLFLLDAFPELKKYVDDEEALLHLADYNDYDDFKSDYDEVLDWVSPEEYKNMSEIKRNQLALDRYKKGKKSDWQIGMEYEMYVGHLLRINNFTVEQCGIEKGMQDLGRDIIARRVENGILKIYIIQCKNWSKKKEVHENVVCQLYGTAMQYELANRDTFVQKTEVIPWLVITNELSDMAKKFAKKLGIFVSVRPLQDFPMIKCNINNGDKIYHLPFDQQYYRTQIKLPGEFYASTVEEAVKAGFRRARRHIFENN